MEFEDSLFIVAPWQSQDFSDLTIGEIGKSKQKLHTSLVLIDTQSDMHMTKLLSFVLGIRDFLQNKHLNHESDNIFTFGKWKVKIFEKK